MLGTVPSHLFGDGTLTYYILPSGRNAIGYLMLICFYYLVCLFSTKTLLKKKTSFAAVRW